MFIKKISLAIKLGKISHHSQFISYIIDKLLLNNEINYNFKYGSLIEGEDKV